MAERHSSKISGIRLGVVNAGIKQTERPDLCLIEIAEGASCASQFTQNRFAAAPVIVAKKHRADNPKTRFLLINSGNANCGTGDAGIKDTSQLCEEIAKITGSAVNAVLPFSTGVIGERLPVSKIMPVLPELVANLDQDRWQAAAGAIMTTDTRPKLATAEFGVGSQKYAVTGIAKGSGMIKPNMATMLSFIATDANVPADALQNALQVAVEKTFNRITVDGDTSTNDAVVLVATGNDANYQITESHSAWSDFNLAIETVCESLAKAIVADGEGATKFVEIEVRSQNDVVSKSVAYTVAESPLVKTALFASDPNWGRILAAIGRAPGPDFDIDQVSIRLNDYEIVRAGSVVPDYSEDRSAEEMAKSEIKISIGIGKPETSCTVWTCDLSYDYVKINAEYRT